MSGVYPGKAECEARAQSGRDIIHKSLQLTVVVFCGKEKTGDPGVNPTETERRRETGDCIEMELISHYTTGSMSETSQPG